MFDDLRFRLRAFFHRKTVESELDEELRAHLENEIALRVAGVSRASAQVLRINLVESEYLIAMLRAELAWVRSLISEISSGDLSWNLKSVLKGARASALAAAHPKE